MFFYNCLLANESYNNMDMITSNGNLHKQKYYNEYSAQTYLLAKVYTITRNIIQHKVYYL